MPDGTVAASLARALTDFASARGADASALLNQAGIDAQDLLDRDNRIAMARYVDLMRTAKAMTGDPALPLRFGAEIDLADVSIVGLLGQASSTMIEAMQQLNRFGKLVIEVDVGGDRFANIADERGMWAVDRRVDPNTFYELTEVTFARMLCGVRRIAPELRALEIHVTHDAPDHASEYEPILGAPVTFNAVWNAYRVDPTFVSFPIQKQPRYVFAILTRHAETLLARMAEDTTARGRVESLLMPILHTGEIGIDSIAEKMAMSRQTLYRRLKAEGMTFESVLDDLRERMAKDYLETKKTSINETAYLVGFSEPAAFSRAFKRWTGISPRDYLGTRKV